MSAHASRSVARLAAVQALYQMEVSSIGVEHVIREFTEHRFDRALEGGDGEDATLATADESFFAELVRGVVSQQLLQRADKQGRVAALEILINTPAVSNLIRQGKLDQLENTMQSGAAHGMRTMDTAIQQLLDQRVITGAEAYKKGINKAKFEALKDAG